MVKWRDAMSGRVLAMRGRRVRGRPSSSNAASSMHCFWDKAPGVLRSVSVVCRIEAEPSVDELYFWALQVSFVDDDGGDAGAAHLGLQWHPAHPGRTAVNFGGYAADGSELAGSGSPLASATSNPNTRDFAWRAGHEYVLTIDGRRGLVTDVHAGATTFVRDLDAGGTLVRSPVVWSEVFARCDDPATTASWTGLSAVAAYGSGIRAGTVTTSYQDFAHGGCTNTDIVAIGDGFEHRTNTVRTTPQGAELHLGGNGQPVRP